MAGLEHTFRLGLFHRKRTYRLAPDALEWRDSRSQGRIAYDQIEEIHSFKVRKFGVGGQTRSLVWRCVLRSREHKAITLAQEHYVRLGAREDRQRSFGLFANVLTARIARANPSVEITQGHTGRPEASAGLTSGIATRIAPLALWLLRSLPRQRTAAMAGWLMRTIGPWIPEHKVGRANLAAAFPEMSAAEIESLLRCVWDNYGRVCAEIVQLDRITDSDLREGGRIVLDPASVRQLEQYRREGQPVLIFTAHLASWEVIAPVAKALGLDVVVPVRIQHVGLVAKLIGEARPGGEQTYIPVDRNAPAKIKSAIDRGAGVAVMIDQHMQQGIDVNFFGRPCKATPVLARLARTLERPIIGIRAVRLPDQRIRIETVGPIETPRDSRGRIDIAQTTQVITSVVEEWVREYPDQWLWLHRRWR